MYRRLVAFVAGVVGVSGCYVRRAIHEPGPVAGATVEIKLTPDATMVLSSLIGSNVRLLDGRVVTRVPDSLVIAITRAVRTDGTAQEWRGERVAIARSSIATVEGRRLSPVTTGILVSGTVVGLVLAAKAVRRPPRLQ